MSLWTTIKEGISLASGVVKLGNWATKKKDQADLQEAGAAKQRSADADKTLDAIADAKGADAAMRRPGSKRAKRVRSKYSRDGEGGD